MRVSRGLSVKTFPSERDTHTHTQREREIERERERKREKKRERETQVDKVDLPKDKGMRTDVQHT